jgi:hypothetical protein
MEDGERDAQRRERDEEKREHQAKGLSRGVPSGEYLAKGREWDVPPLRIA